MTVAACTLDMTGLGGTLAIPMSTGSLPDTELVSRAKRGDLSAFEALFRKNQGRVYALCLRMVADPARAEDLTQDAFVRAWQKLGSFRGQSAFTTWLHRLAVNVVLGDLRSRKRWEEKTTEIEGHEPNLRAARPRDSVAGIDLESAIATLPSQARLVFLLHDVEGYKHREIGVVLGLAEGTCKAHLHRARNLLKKALNR